MTSSISSVLFRGLQLFGNEQRAVDERDVFRRQAAEEMQTVSVDERHFRHVDLDSAAGLQQFGTESLQFVDPAPSHLANESRANDIARRPVRRLTMNPEHRGRGKRNARARSSAM